MLIYRFTSKVILFKKALQYCETIVHCYSGQTIIRISVHVPPLLTWHVAQIVVDVPSFVIIACVLNQSHGHWFLNDVLHSAITMNIKLIEELQNHSSFGNIMDEDFGLANELTLMASNIQEEVYVVLDSFLYCLRKYEKRKTHNIIF
jgi:hypothetical protein